MTCPRLLCVSTVNPLLISPSYFLFCLCCRCSDSIEYSTLWLRVADTSCFTGRCSQLCLELQRTSSSCPLLPCSHGLLTCCDPTMNLSHSLVRIDSLARSSLVRIRQLLLIMIAIVLLMPDLSYSCITYYVIFSSYGMSFWQNKNAYYSYAICVFRSGQFYMSHTT